jgi:hypothetical protein
MVQVRGNEECLGRAGAANDAWVLCTDVVPRYIHQIQYHLSFFSPSQLIWYTVECFIL